MIRRLLPFIAVASCVPAAAHAAGFDDPVAYCKSVGTADRVGQDYTGPAVPDWMAEALKRTAGAPADAPLEVFRHAAWRCDQGRVMACSTGANIPCDSKADTSRKPATGARRFCKEHPSTPMIPAYATGHATAYAWRCDGDRAIVARQVLTLDDRGYPAAFWHEVTPR